MAPNISNVLLAVCPNDPLCERHSREGSAGQTAAHDQGTALALQAHIGEPPDREVPGVAVGAALCCLPGATLGALYDDRRVSKEAAVLEKEAYIREAAAQARRRCGAHYAEGPVTKLKQQSQ